MEKTPCSSCLKPKAQLVCGPCQSPLCKNCAEFLDEDHFALWPEAPAEAQHAVYCHSCYATHVIPAETEFEDRLARAKQVLIFYKKEHKETRFVRRLEEPVKIESCEDRDQSLMRLAFHAIAKGYNAVLDVDLVSEKIRSGSYQTTVWHVTGIPAQVDKIPRPQQHT